MPDCLHPVVQRQGRRAEVLGQILCPARPFKKPLADPAGMEEQTVLQGTVQESRLCPESNREPLKTWQEGVT